MTEQEWLACTGPTPMLEFLRGKVSTRKLLLFLCACGWRLKGLLVDDRCKLAIDGVERYVDGKANRGTLIEALLSTEAVMEDFVGADDIDPYLGAAILAHDIALAAAEGYEVDFLAGLANSATEAVATATTDSIPAAPHEIWVAARDSEATAQAALIREVVGSPFRPVSVDPGWRTPNVVKLAQGIYGERAFSRMPELAEALEKTGCTDAEVLAHCRQPGEHVRGCWVVDLLLAKE